jgi:hypothetical protein
MGDATPAASNVTELLRAWSGGDRRALDRLVPVVYAELRRRAERQLRRESAGHTLQPTALVHEGTSSSPTSAGPAGRGARSSSASPRS